MLHQIANYFSVSPDSLKLQTLNKKVFTRKDHILSLKMLGITDKDTIVMDDADIPQMGDTPIINQEKTDFTEQVNLVWREIFNEHSVDDKMNPDQFASFVSKSTNGASCSPRETRIINVFNKYDSEDKGYLDFESFIAFFRDSALQSYDRFIIVKQNLQSLGYNGEFKLKKPSIESEHQLIVNSLRYKLTNDQEIFTRLYECLNHLDMPRHASRLFPFLANIFYIPKVDLIHALNDPLDFISNIDNICLLNYRTQIVNTLITSPESILEYLLYEIPDFKSRFEAFPQKIFTSQFLQMLSKSASLIQKVCTIKISEDMFLNPIRLLAKLLKAMLAKV